MDNLIISDNHPRMLRRLGRHHAVIALASCVGVGLFYWLVGILLGISGAKFVFFRLSMATGYIAVMLLVTTLIIGPINLLRQKRNSISTDFRRDVGIWCAMVSFTHFIIGWNVHMQHRLLYFFDWTSDNRWTLRTDLFGFANYTGLFGILIVFILLATSNDYALRKLGGKRWKSVQRWNYALAFFALLHSVAYQIIEKRSLKFVAFFSVLMATAILFQILGYRKIRLER